MCFGISLMSEWNLISSIRPSYIHTKYIYFLLKKKAHISLWLVEIY
jgi:hypothetical protein